MSNLKSLSRQRYADPYSQYRGPDNTAQPSEMTERTLPWYPTFGVESQSEHKRLTIPTSILLNGLSPEGTTGSADGTRVMSGCTHSPTNVDGTY